MHSTLGARANPRGMLAAVSASRGAEADSGAGATPHSYISCGGHVPSGQPFKLLPIVVETRADHPALLLRASVRRWWERRGRQVPPLPLDGKVEAMILEWFQMVNLAKDGRLTSKELVAGFKLACIPFPEEAIQELTGLIDFDGSSVIEWHEFHHFVSYAVQSGQDLSAGELVLPSGKSLPLGPMIHQLRRRQLLDDITQGGAQRDRGLLRVQEYLRMVAEANSETGMQPPEARSLLRSTSLMPESSSDVASLVSSAPQAVGQAEEQGGAAVLGADGAQGDQQSRAEGRSDMRPRREAVGDPRPRTESRCDARLGKDPVSDLRLLDNCLTQTQRLPRSSHARASCDGQFRAWQDAGAGAGTGKPRPWEGGPPAHTWGHQLPAPFGAKAQSVRHPTGTAQVPSMGEHGNNAGVDALSALKQPTPPLAISTGKNPARRGRSNRGYSDGGGPQLQPALGPWQHSPFSRATLLNRPDSMLRCRQAGLVGKPSVSLPDIHDWSRSGDTPASEPASDFDGGTMRATAAAASMELDLCHSLSRARDGEAARTPPGHTCQAFLAHAEGPDAPGPMQGAAGRGTLTVQELQRLDLKLTTLRRTLRLKAHRRWNV